MSNNPFIGRRDAVGIGVETTAGTAVAPAAFKKQLTLKMDQKTTVAKDTSAVYRVEDQEGSDLTERWAEGSINGNLSDHTDGYLLANMFGTCVATIHASETTVWDNLFTVNQAQVGIPTLTFARLNPVEKLSFPFGNLQDLTIDSKTGGYVSLAGSVMANAGVTCTDTPSYLTENLFTSKHVTVKIASNVSGLTGATALAQKSVQLKLARKLTRFTPEGVIDPTAWDTGTWTVTGQIVQRYTDTSLEAIALANTPQAMSIALVNTDVTIGSAANPGLVFTMPQVRFAPMTLDNNLDQVVSQTFSFKAELNAAAGYMIQAVLTNTKNGYAT